jgi:hypothetical protein
VRITVVCAHCGHRNPLERRVFEEAELHLVCHGCEQSLMAVLSLELRRERALDHAWRPGG